MSQDHLSKFSKSLKRRMSEKGISWGQLSDRSGVAAGTVSLLKNGLCTNPCVATLSRLANAVGCHVEINLKIGPVKSVITEKEEA